MEEPRPPGPAQKDAPHPDKMSVERWIFAMLPLIALGSLGAWLSLQGNDAGSIFLALVAVIIGLWVVGFVHRRRVPPQGPPDPSAAWRPARRADSGIYEFAYSRSTLWSVRCIFGASLLVAPLAYLTTMPHPKGAGFWWIAVLVVVLNGGLMLLALACERYRVEVSAGGLVHYRLRAPLRYLFATLGSVALLEGGGRGAKYVLALYNKQGRCIDTFADTLEGFTELVALTKEYALAAGVPYRYRDKWGAWTR